MAFDLKVLRQALREAREAQSLGRDALAAKIGVAKSTIQSAEMGPKVPKIDTVARMIEAIPGLTLSSFFARIERQTESDLSDSADARRTTRPPEESVKSGRQGRTVPLDAPSLLAAGDALVEAGGRLIAAASGIPIGKDARATDHVRRTKPAKGARRAANR